MKKLFKNKNGITLISLVVTIIILLILAGISIGMLSGDNGILGQAGNAKTQTDIAGEKEIIDLAVVHAMGKSKYGDIDETSFTNELEKNNATVTKSGSKYKVAFSSGRQYEVDQDGNVKEKKVNPNALEISELNQNARTFFGWDVINYAETLPVIGEGNNKKDYTDTTWQLFYAGKIDENNDKEEERIYIIAKDFIKYELLPTKNEAKLLGSGYTAKFGTNVNDGIMAQYSGSSDIAINLQKYNKDYFKDYTSTNPNMIAIAYMMDTEIWKPFSTSSKNYAEYAIGGPTVELLFTAYNKYAGTSYEADAVSANGYQVRKKSTDNFSTGIQDAITEQPYSRHESFWLASPQSYNDTTIMYVQGTNPGYTTNKGRVSSNYYNNAEYSFLPIVILNSDYTLEKTKDKNGKDAFKIVEQ